MTSEPAFIRPGVIIASQAANFHACTEATGLSGAIARLSRHGLWMRGDKIFVAQARETGFAFDQADKTDCPHIRSDPR